MSASPHSPSSSSTAASGHAAGLARNMGLFSLIVYGVGDMVGAGIYGTIGVAAGVMGNAVWLSFVISMVAALLTGLSYAALGSRYPKAGGASYITQRAYAKPFLSYVVGLSVTFSGLTSMAAGANVFAQTLGATFPSFSVSLILVVFLGLLALVNFIGIRESMWMNLVFTVIEVAGLVFVIVIGARYWGRVDYLEVPVGQVFNASLLLSGAVLTFYAFIGFEDMLNVSEEVKNPEKNLPRGIIWAVSIATLLYILISITAVSVVNSQDLANPQNGAPLAQITAKAVPWLPSWIYGAITLFAVGNTALLNYIMGSRLLYGMARQGLLPSPLGWVHGRTRTPHVSIFVLGVVVLILAFAGNIQQLASATSLLLLGCFCVVNSALVVLIYRREEPKGAFEVPVIVPVLGVLVCAGLIVGRLSAAGMDFRAPLIAGILVTGIALFYFILKPKEKVERQ
jgi:basic amino acid/polyamine antiporter, APA family